MRKLIEHPLDIDELSDRAFSEVLRTSTSKPGFLHLKMEDSISSYQFRRTMVNIKKAMAKQTERKWGKTLNYQWLSRFDQQENTKFHRDNAADESVLILGYEPSTIPARLFIADHVAFAKEDQLSPTEFFDVYNPLMTDLEQLLAQHLTEVEDFKHDHYNILIINNSDSDLTYGVLHKALMLEQDPQKPRIANSMMLHLVDASKSEVSTEEHSFLSTDEVDK